MPTVKERLYGKIGLPDENGCALWTGATARGYGRIKVRGRVVQAHRLTYELLVGPIPEGMDIDHVKDRGCRSTLCCTPGHLEPVTKRVNTRRGRTAEANRARAALITRCPAGHKYTPGNTYVDKNGWRKCLTCHRQRWHDLGYAERRRHNLG